MLPPLLKKARAKGDFDGRDAALATELVYGTLRRQGTYDAIVAACIDRPLREVDPPVLDVLNMGVHQLLGTRIPPTRPSPPVWSWPGWCWGRGARSSSTRCCAR